MNTHPIPNNSMFLFFFQCATLEELSKDSMQCISRSFRGFIAESKYIGMVCRTGIIRVIFPPKVNNLFCHERSSHNLSHQFLMVAYFPSPIECRTSQVCERVTFSFYSCLPLDHLDDLDRHFVMNLERVYCIIDQLP